MKKQSVIQIILFLVIVIPVVVIFSPARLQFKILAGTFIPITICVEIIYVIYMFYKWTVEGFRLSMHGDKILGEGLTLTLKSIERVYQTLENNPELLKTLNGKQITLSLETLKETDGEMKKLNNKIVEIERKVTDMQPELKAMKFHFKFLLWLIPVALAIIAILIKTK